MIELFTDFFVIWIAIIAVCCTLNCLFKLFNWAVERRQEPQESNSGGAMDIEANHNSANTAASAVAVTVTAGHNNYNPRYSASRPRSRSRIRHTRSSNITLNPTIPVPTAVAVTYEANKEEKERREALVRSHLIYQQVLSLPSSNKQEQQQHECSLPSTSIDDSDNCSGTSGVTMQQCGLKTMAMTGSSSLSPLPSMVSSLVYSVEGGPDMNAQEKSAAAEILKNQECCSICLEEFVVGDVVAHRWRRKTKKKKKKKKKQPKLCSSNDLSGVVDNCAAEGDNGDDDDVATCNHCFHESCILQWLQNHDECPLCRVNMMQK
uniref:RING-type domain-containing protein n=1 Tax=Pseudo-nitzschia australis TaxID=44445 RepID=A0A7S4ACH3_9STRA|mmetsp:Transcript_19038/g.41389  ORF Transcript_19038/g.41389 Transcript_19038/m.41389 type:complete len:320 (-) Transcript_19038:552-1511(-)